MKHLRETFTEEEFERLLKVKGKLNWHDFILTLTEEPKVKTLLLLDRHTQIKKERKGKTE